MTAINISPEAVEHLCAIHEGYEQHGTVATLRALSAECERLKVINKKLCADFNLMNQHGAKQGAALTKSQAECTNLAAWQCVYTDGKTGIVCDEYGNQFCQKSRNLERSRAETAAAYERAAKAAMGHCYAIMSATDADARAALIAVSIRAIATPDQTAALDKLIAEAVKPYVEALEFYADEENYETQYERMPCDCCTDIFEPINEDKGAKARNAILALIGEKA